MGKHKAVKTAWNFIDLTGRKYNFLTVISFKGRIKKRSLWNCICDCGNTHIVEAYNLKTGQVKSCGCYSSPKAKSSFYRPNRRTHGLSNHILYSIWNAMQARCRNKNNIAYERYGGRGISLCNKWKKFIGFYEDMHESYENGLTLERIDVNGNYEPNNCRWATYKEQANNTRKNRVVTYMGITGSVVSVCDKLGIDSRMVHRRLSANWDIQRAFAEPKMTVRMNNKYKIVKV